MRLALLLPLSAALACGLSYRPAPQSVRDAALQASRVAGEHLSCQPPTDWVGDLQVAQVPRWQIRDICTGYSEITACLTRTDDGEIDGFWGTVFGSDPILLTVSGQDPEGAVRHEAGHVVLSHCTWHRDDTHTHELWCVMGEHHCRPR